MLSEAERREQEERSAITELLFFASTGNVARMQALIALYDTNVRPRCKVTAKWQTCVAVQLRVLDDIVAPNPFVDLT